MEMLSRSLNNKQFRYVALGGVTTAFNLITIFLIVQWFNVNTPLFRNIANICAIEISLIFSFFIYRLGVWQQSSWNPKKFCFANSSCTI
jgi:dolichol-phosphate mannosyltransferase